ncbi:MAG: hypothetical protein AAGD18_08460 [Actinomycetota bacterium]
MRRLVLALVALVVLAGCRGELAVDVEVLPDGSGSVTVTVTVDEEAIAEVPELAGGLRVDDLAAAGWVLERPAVESGAVLRATKGFGSPEALPGVLAEIDGADGVVVGSSLTVVQGVDERSYDLSMTIDPRRELVDLSDAEVTELLDGSALGRADADLGDVDLSMIVRLTVPGAEPVERRFAAGDSPGEVSTSSVVVDDEALALRSDADDQRELARTVALGLAVAWVLVLLWWWLGRRRRRRAPEPPSEPPPGDDAPRLDPTPMAAPTPAAALPGPRPAPAPDDIEVDTGEWRPG